MNNDRSVERFYWFTLLDAAQTALLTDIGERQVSPVVDARTFSFDPRMHIVNGKVDVLSCVVSAKHGIHDYDDLMAYRFPRIVEIINAANALSGEPPIERLTDGTPVTDRIKHARDKVLTGKEFNGYEWIVQDIEEASPWFLDYLCTETSDQIVKNARFALENALKDLTPKKSSGQTTFPKAELRTLVFWGGIAIAYGYSIYHRPLKEVGDLFYLFSSGFLFAIVFGANLVFMSRLKEFRDFKKKFAARERSDGEASSRE